MTQTCRDNCNKNIVQQTSCEPLFPDVQTSNAVKTYFAVPFIRTCMHHNYGRLSESDACRDCVWPIILYAKLYITCPGEGVLVVMTHQVQCNIPIFEALLRKNMYVFLERCRRSNNQGKFLQFLQLFFAASNSCLNAQNICVLMF